MATFPDMDASSSTRLQTFRRNQTVENITVLARWDPDTGQHVIYWEDIQRIFASARAVLNNGEPVPFLENANSEVLLPQRISHYPDSVLEVIEQTCGLDENTSSLVQQRLPDDILYHFINWGCCQDLSLLHTLLFVNKFFFRAALPHVWRNAIETWSMRLRGRGGTIGEEKLMATTFAAFLEARLLEQDEQELQQPVQSSGRRKTDAQRVDEILEPFGLRISDQVRSPMLRLYLMDSTEAEEGQENQMMCTHRKRRMTVDYSKCFRSLLSGQILYVDFKYLIQLRILDNNGSDIGGDGGNFNEEQERTLRLWDSFRKLLLHYNYETITDLTMHISDASKYLSLAPKMAKLRVLELDRSETPLPDSHVDDMVSFIQQNRKAFPRKHPIQLSFWYWSWRKYDRDFLNGHDFVIPPGSVVDESNIKSYESQIMAHVERQRRSRYRFVEPQIRLLEAAGSSRVLESTSIPFFYKHAHGIELDRLEEFMDFDKDRMDYGEGDDMQAFLRRCHHLQKLSLCVGSKDLLTWAAVDALTAAGYSSEVSSTGLRFHQMPNGLLTSPSPDPGSSSLPSQTSQPLLRGPRPSGILQNLRSLELQCDGLRQFVIHALNDAMVAFAGTLCTIRVSVSRRFIKPWDTEWTAKSIMTRRTVRMREPLEDEPWANWIGGGPGQVLPFPLLQLRTLLIWGGEALDMEIGSFEQCPNLESLLIQYGDVSWDELGHSIKDIVSVGQNDDDGSIRARISLFPTWNLPRLRELNLQNMAALRFDWESLSSMARLEKLEMFVDMLDCYYMPSHYLEDQKDAWKRKMDLRDKNNNINNKGLDGLDSGNSESWIWPLPRLHTLSLRGQPVTLFYLDWIRFCPNLESLRLDLGINRYIIPRFSPLASTSSESLLNLDNVDGQQPLLHSRLSTINMDWMGIMSEGDLQTLLTIYAPFLKRLDMRGIVEYDDDPTMMTLSQFVKVVHQADQINKSYAETLLATIQSYDELHSSNKDDSNNNNNAANASEQEQHRRRLEALGSTLEPVISLDIAVAQRKRNVLQQLGLVPINFTQVENFRAKKMRVYSIGTQTQSLVVSQVDHDLVLSETESNHILQDN